jgi:hypothetical protein
VCSSSWSDCSSIWSRSQKTGNESS